MKDKISGLEGIVTSVTFDLYGCIQVIVNPGLDKEGKQREPVWLDIKRLEITSKAVMAPPDFSLLKFGQEQGPAERPRTMPP